MTPFTGGGGETWGTEKARLNDEIAALRQELDVTTDDLMHAQELLEQVKAERVTTEAELWRVREVALKLQAELQAKDKALRERGLDLDKLQREIIRLQVVAALEGNPDGARAQENKG